MLSATSLLVYKTWAWMICAVKHLKHSEHFLCATTRSWTCRSICACDGGRGDGFWSLLLWRKRKYFCPSCLALTASSLLYDGMWIAVPNKALIAFPQMSSWEEASSLGGQRSAGLRILIDELFCCCSLSPPPHWGCGWSLDPVWPRLSYGGASTLLGTRSCSHPHARALPLAEK